MNLIAKMKNAKCWWYIDVTLKEYKEYANFPLLSDDGYRLTYGGLDYLAMNVHQKSKSIYSVGNQIGVGKESDIIVVANRTGTQRILKIHRLGRISFRTVKANRDYLRNRSTGSWMYMSRLAATKEFAFMKALRENGFSVPEPIAQNRHTVVMSLINAFPLRQISEVPRPALLYSELMDMILRLARFGLIHGDFNEFNILIKEEEEEEEEEEETQDIKGKAPENGNTATDKEETINIRLVPVLIDFPQMVSIDHENAEMYFDRDVNCIKRFFDRKFHFVSDEPGPFFSDAKKQLRKNPGKRLDVEVEASGFSKKMAKQLEAYMKEVGANDEDDSKVDTGDDEGDEPIDEETEEEEEEDENGQKQSTELLESSRRIEELRI